MVCDGAPCDEREYDRRGSDGMPGHLSPLQQLAVRRARYPPVPANCAVTGGTGFVGMRLVEMLVERGAKRVVCFDIVPPQAVKHLWLHPNIVYQVGDITNQEDVNRAIEGADCVWHLAAAVGPFHPDDLYKRVNYGGTLNVIAACRQYGVKQLVMSSSPSTRFEGSMFRRPCVEGLTEAQMPTLPLPRYMQRYAETKAMGEIAVTDACDDTLLTVSVAPHQVYGPRDNLFLPNLLEAAGSGTLRIFGNGKNRICFTHVDNYCHALIIAQRKLYPGSPVLGKFYIATDGDTHPEPAAYCLFWKELDKAVTGMGFASLESKFHLPFALLYALALCAELFTFVTGIVTKLNVFNVFVLTMHRWFDISAIENDLGYKPIVGFDEGWKDTIEWFRENWLPGYIKVRGTGGLVGIAQQSQHKIDVQAHSVRKQK